MDMPAFSTLKIYPQTVLTLLIVLENPSFVFWALRCGLSRLPVSVVSDSLRAAWTVAHQAPLSMGILQARTLEWVAMPSSRGSSRLRDRTQVAHIAGRFCTI